MGVYINMEIPTSPVLFCIHPDGKVFADLEGNWREYKAVSVPPHGDLIDKQVADELNQKDYEAMGSDRYTDYARGVVLNCLNAAPIIIPAEGGK